MEMNCQRSMQNSCGSLQLFHVAKRRVKVICQENWAETKSKAGSDFSPKLILLSSRMCCQDICCGKWLIYARFDEVGRFWEEESTVWEYNHQRPTHYIYDTLQSSIKAPPTKESSYLWLAAMSKVQLAIVGLNFCEFACSFAVSAASCCLVFGAVWPIWATLSSLQRLTTPVEKRKNFTVLLIFVLQSNRACKETAEDHTGEYFQHPLVQSQNIKTNKR